MLQTLVIVFLASWAYQEYVYNQYLKEYINSYFQGNGLIVVILGSIGVFTVVGMMLYSKLRHARRALETADRSGGRKKEDAGSSKILDTRMEQHLMEMLRRTRPADSSPPQQMPVLNRDEPPAGSNEQ